MPPLVHDREDCTVRDDDADVLDVGAGLAGLACARTLERAGLSVIVVEAAEEVGGRMRTDLVDWFLCDNLRLNQNSLVANRPTKHGTEPNGDPNTRSDRKAQARDQGPRLESGRF